MSEDDRAAESVLREIEHAIMLARDAESSVIYMPISKPKLFYRTLLDKPRRPPYLSE